MSFYFIVVNTTSKEIVKNEQGVWKFYSLAYADTVASKANPRHCILRVTGKENAQTYIPDIKWPP